MKINKFKKISKNRYKVFIDEEEFILFENVILKYNLLYKKDIDIELLENIKIDNIKEEVYNVALSYIEVRKRSKLEIYKYLRNRKYSENDIELAINRLENQKLIDDLSFTKSYINDKLYLTTSGPYKIKNELINLGISEDIISECISNIDKNIIINKLNRIIEKEIKINKNLTIYKLKNKIINKCINLGYLYEDINEILSNISIVSSCNIKNDYDKFYLKYKNKYDEYKLKEVIRSKLYQKGYSIEEINMII